MNDSFAWFILSLIHTSETETESVTGSDRGAHCIMGVPGSLGLDSGLKRVWNQDLDQRSSCSQTVTSAWNMIRVNVRSDSRSQSVPVSGLRVVGLLARCVLGNWAALPSVHNNQ